MRNVGHCFLFIDQQVLVAPKDLSASLEDLRSAKASPKPDRLRQFRAAAAYDVVFTLIHGRPERVSVQWDMPRALRFYIDPFAAKLGRYISLSFKSQFLHYVHVPIQPRRSTDQPGSFYTADNLPHLVNAFEHYLSSGASVNPTLHLIVYVPPEEHHPLRLREVRKVGLPDAFLSPRWGGVQVYNIAPQRNRSTGLVRHDVDMRKVRMFVIFSRHRTEWNCWVRLRVCAVGTRVFVSWRFDKYSVLAFITLDLKI